MRNYTLLSLLFFYTLFTISCSNVYQTSGGTIATPRRNFLNGAKIDLIIFDVRPEKHRGIDLEHTIQQHISRSYPRAWVRVRDKSAFFKEPSNGVITLKLKIDEYEITQRYVSTNTNTPLSNRSFAVGNAEQVNAVMTLLSTILDYRKGVATRKNATLTEAYPMQLREDGGFKNDGMGIVFQKSLDRLCNFIDNNLE
jgi:hypothetical protein